jgi:hypothetical protein
MDRRFPPAAMEKGAGMAGAASSPHLVARGPEDKACSALASGGCASLRLAFFSSLDVNLPDMVLPTMVTGGATCT